MRYKNGRKCEKALKIFSATYTNLLSYKNKVVKSWCGMKETEIWLCCDAVMRMKFTTNYVKHYCIIKIFRFCYEGSCKRINLFQD